MLKRYFRIFVYCIKNPIITVSAKSVLSHWNTSEYFAKVLKLLPVHFEFLQELKWIYFYIFNIFGVIFLKKFDQLDNYNENSAIFAFQ